MKTDRCGRLTTWWHRRMRAFDWGIRVIAFGNLSDQGFSTEDMEAGWQHFIRYRWYWHCPCSKEHEALLVKEESEANLTKAS